MDEFEASEVPAVCVTTTPEADSLVDVAAVQRRLSTSQSRMTQSVQLANRALERVQLCEREKDWLRLEMESLQVWRDKHDVIVQQVRPISLYVGRSWVVFFVFFFFFLCAVISRLCFRLCFGMVAAL
jgi:hypothetical protein